MKIVKQFMIIIVICFVGEVAHDLMPLPVSSSIYGLLLLLFLLVFKVIKVEQVEDVAGFFMKIMPILFVSPCVSLMVATEELRVVLVGFCVAVSLSTIGVMLVTGQVAQFFVRLRNKKNSKQGENA